MKKFLLTMGFMSFFSAHEALAAAVIKNEGDRVSSKRTPMVVGVAKDEERASIQLFHGVQIREIFTILEVEAPDDAASFGGSCVALYYALEGLHIEGGLGDTPAIISALTRHTESLLKQEDDAVTAAAADVRTRVKEVPVTLWSKLTRKKHTATPAELGEANAALKEMDAQLVAIKTGITSLEKQKTEAENAVTHFKGKTTASVEALTKEFGELWTNYAKKHRSKKTTSEYAEHRKAEASGKADGHKYHAKAAKALEMHERATSLKLEDHQEKLSEAQAFLKGYDARMKTMSSNLEAQAAVIAELEANLSKHRERAGVADDS